MRLGSVSTSESKLSSNRTRDVTTTQTQWLSVAVKKGGSNRDPTFERTQTLERSTRRTLPFLLLISFALGFVPANPILAQISGQSTTSSGVSELARQMLKLAKLQAAVADSSLFQPSYSEVRLVVSGTPSVSRIHIRDKPRTLEEVREYVARTYVGLPAEQRERLAKALYGVDHAIVRSREQLGDAALDPMIRARYAVEADNARLKQLTLEVQIHAIDNDVQNQAENLLDAFDQDIQRTVFLEGVK